MKKNGSGRKQAAYKGCRTLPKLMSAIPAPPRNVNSAIALVKRGPLAVSNSIAAYAHNESPGMPNRTADATRVTNLMNQFPTNYALSLWVGFHEVNLI